MFSLYLLKFEKFYMQLELLFEYVCTMPFIRLLLINKDFLESKDLPFFDVHGKRIYTNYTVFYFIPHVRTGTAVLVTILSTYVSEASLIANIVTKLWKNMYQFRIQKKWVLYTLIQWRRTALKSVRPLPDQPVRVLRQCN